MVFASTPVSTPEIVWWALLPVIVLAVSALLLLTVSSLLKKAINWLASTVSLTAGVFVLVSTIPIWNKIQNDGAIAFLNDSIGIDGSTVFLTSLIAIAVITTSIIARPYLNREGIPDSEFYVLLLLSAAGGVVMATANDLIVLFLGIEILSIAVYVLVALHLRKIESQEGAIKYFLLGAFSSAFLLYGIALVYGAIGSTNLFAIKNYLASSILVEDGMLMIGFALMIVGLGFKIAAFPFHSWTPDAYQGAPTPVVVWMAAGVKVAGFAALIRVFPLTFASYVDDWQIPIAVLAGLTVVFGSVVAVVQSDVKRMLAYSSIAHAGFILLGVQSANTDGVASVLFYLAIYTFLASGSFAVLTVVGGDGDLNHDITAYKGLAQRKPVLAILFTVLLLGQAGIPFTGGFIAKLGVISSAVDTKLYFLAGIAMVSAAISAYVYLRILMAMYVEIDEDKIAEIHVPKGVWVVTGLASVVVIITGLIPGPIVEITRDAIPILVSG
ncbi:MAG: NADH-quinone oxidoreductase subunit N [Actinomycetota bacterium]|nr:NADH-quinone oxidoreductase subunit N [Actinomycetota bacterium]|tara:strand:+ start:2136 stop:3626 length:1491 start_codon:yes stop_codon:yes gene_type:complete